MKKQLTWSKLKVSLVITLALLALFITVFFAGNIEDLFSPKVQIKAQIKDVRGLRNGSPVWISGIEVGSVKSIDLHPEYGTLVTMSVNSNAVKFIKKDSKVSVLTMGLLGDKYVELSNGSPQASIIKPGDVLEGTTQLEIQDIVNASLVSLGKVTDFVKKLENFIDKLDKSEGSIAKFLTDPALYKNMQEATKTMSVLLKDIKESQGTMKKLIEDPTLYNKLLSNASSIEEFTRKINESSGTLKKLVEDPELYDSLHKASKQLSSILERIDSGEGVAGSLIKDKELSKEVKDTLGELKSSVTEFRELIKDIREDPKKYLKFSVF
ncbi:MAG: MlaD family protein [Nitrospirota bacterium]|nr:MlaD family protein [Nitrospirota bacterium]MDH5768634.1 MlaD family protein [Nitrospirota bacterium]